MMQALPSTDPGPERLLFSNRVQARVAGALNELSQQERTAFVLRHFEGQSIEEISGGAGAFRQCREAQYFSRGAETAPGARAIGEYAIMNHLNEKHLNEEQFVLYYYGEGSAGSGRCRGTSGRVRDVPDRVSDPAARAEFGGQLAGAGARRRIMKRRCGARWSGGCRDGEHSRPGGSRGNRWRRPLI